MKERIKLYGIWRESENKDILRKYFQEKMREHLIGEYYLKIRNVVYILKFQYRRNKYIIGLSINTGGLTTEGISVELIEVEFNDHKSAVEYMSSVVNEFKFHKIKQKT